jgi:hypothetical protein
MEDTVACALEETFSGLDEHILEYLGSVVVSLLEENPENEEELVKSFEGSVVPFVLSSGFTSEESEATRYCHQLAANLFSSNVFKHKINNLDEIRKLEVAHSIEEHSRTTMEATNELMERMWGFDRIRKKTNAEMEAAQSTQSQRQIRKQIKLDKLNEEKELLEAEEDREWEDAQVLPDFTNDNGEKVFIDLFCRIFVEHMTAKLNTFIGYSCS